MSRNTSTAASFKTSYPRFSHEFLAACLSLAIFFGSVGLNKFNLHYGILEKIQLQFIPISLIVISILIYPKLVKWSDQNSLHLTALILFVFILILGFHFGEIDSNIWKYLGILFVFVAGSTILRDRVSLSVFCKVYIVLSACILVAQLSGLLLPEKLSVFSLKVAGPFTTARVGAVAAFLVLVIADTEKKSVRYHLVSGLLIFLFFF